MEDVNLRTLLWTLLRKYGPLLTVEAITLYLIICYFNGGLNRYPGPWLAKFGKLWHRLDVHTNRHQVNLIDLHRKHGDVVRVGPATLSISNPDYVSEIYSVSAGLRKSDMYEVFVPRVNGKRLPSLLSAQDPRVHAELHKPMAKEFSTSIVLGYEPLVDKTLVKWIDAMQQRFCDKPGTICDMSQWVRLFAQESIMDITFSESMGFLSAGGDVDGFLQALYDNTDRSGRLAAMPSMAYIEKHNPILAKLNKDSSVFPGWAAERISRRMKARAESKSNNTQDSSVAQKDYLDRFLDASPSDQPPYYNFSVVMNWCLVNILAGGDTTAVALASIVYYILKNPDKQAQLVQELRSIPLSTPLSWKDCQKIPYLDGCVREGMRLHPSIGLGLERDATGLRMPDGYILPKNTKVSMNAWVVNRQGSVFGDQVDDFIPERWLPRKDESEEDFTVRVNRMKRVDINFGSGARVCTGKFVAFMEIYKAIGTLFYTFDIELENPQAEWTGVLRWLARVSGIHCKIKRAS